MFTGIVEELGEVRRIRGGLASLSLEIGASISSSLELGESVSTNGVCLTVSSKGEGFFTADIMPETLKKSNLREVKAGSRVNLERALTLKSHLGGHLLLGHVDSTAPILKQESKGPFILFTMPYEEEHGPYLIPQGSIAIDGISLTVAHLAPDTFTISLIPHTLSKTTLQLKGPGDRVNLEFDLLGKYVYRMLTLRDGKRGSITKDFLKEQGFF